MEETAMTVKLSRVISYVLMVLGVLLILGSVEPESAVSLWYIVAYAMTGFTLLSFGWRMYVATEPRRIFLNR